MLFTFRTSLPFELRPCAISMLTSQSINTGWSKNLHIFVRLITSSNIDQFKAISNFFHCQNQEKISNSTITKDHTATQVCRYVKVVKCQCLKKQQLKTRRLCNNILRVRRPAARWTRLIFDVKTAGCDSYFRQ